MSTMKNAMPAIPDHFESLPMLHPGALRGAAVATLLMFACGPAVAQPTASDQTLVNVAVLPTAQLEFVGTPLLSLAVPPATSTIPSKGVTFRVSGNASATVVAEPDDFIIVPTPDYPLGEHMGRAVLNGNSVGYRLRLDFPSASMALSPIAYAGLPGYQSGPTEPPLTVNLLTSSGQRNGRVHLEASQQWTPDGGLPLPGIYVGEVFLTVTAN